MWRDMPAEQVSVKRGRLGPKPGALLDPDSAVLAERDSTRVRVDPVTVKDLGFLAGEPDLRLGFGVEGVIGRTEHAVRARVTGLEPARGQAAHRAEAAATALTVWHRAPPGDGDGREDQGADAGLV